MTRTTNCERISHGTKRTYNDKGDDQAMPDPDEGPTQTNNVPTASCTVRHLERNTRSYQDLPMCHHRSNSSGSVNTRRRPRMASDDVKLPLSHGNRTEDIEQYFFLCEAVWTMKQVQDEDIKKGQIVKLFEVAH